MRALFLAFLMAGFLALPALAQQSNLKTSDLPDVQAVENYLNGITTLRARFIQTANDGQQSQGVFMLKRPGRMRFEYQVPNKDLIVADGLLIYFYDAELKEQKNMPISRSLADFFLRKNLKLSDGVRVTDVKREGGLLQLTVVEAKNDLGGSLTLGFTEKPLALNRWQVVDAQGAVTQIELEDIETGIKLDGNLFHYYDPALKKPNYN